MKIEASPADLGSADKIHSPIRKEEGSRRGLECAMSLSLHSGKLERCPWDTTALTGSVRDLLEGKNNE